MKAVLLVLCLLGAMAQSAIVCGGFVACIEPDGGVNIELAGEAGCAGCPGGEGVEPLPAPLDTLIDASCLCTDVALDASATAHRAGAPSLVLCSHLLAAVVEQPAGRDGGAAALTLQRDGRWRPELAPHLVGTVVLRV